jgi:hypothetical protein
MEPKTEKMALFIDGANLYATAKSLGFDIDYKRLLSEFQSRGYLLRAFYVRCPWRGCIRVPNHWARTKRALRPMWWH